MALGGTMVAGHADLMFSSGWPKATSTTSAYYYETAHLKNYCPSSADRTAIATFMGAQAGLTV
jgi:hypothetical protein